MFCRRYGFATSGRGGRERRSHCCVSSPARPAIQSIAASHADLGERYLYCEGDVPLLFTENETNNERIFGQPNASPYVKDGINNYVVNGKQEAVNPRQSGTKSSAHYQVSVGAGKTATIRLRLSDLPPAAMGDPFNEFAETMADPQARGR